MNWKIIFIGGAALYATQFLLGFLTGPLIHEGVLDDLYIANTSFWRPELVQDPPDMAALMPRWITVGLIAAFIAAGIYAWIRGSFSGASWLKGLKFGFVLWLLAICQMAGWSGIFNLPEAIWGWWAVDSLLYCVIGGVVLGWVAHKLSPEN